MKLTQTQIELLLPLFIQDQNLPGLKGIATQLLNTGKCAVPEDRSYWIGGVGNFITEEDLYEVAVGVVELNLNIGLLLRAKETQDHLKKILKETREKKEVLSKLIDETYDLILQPV